MVQLQKMLALSMSLLEVGLLASSGRGFSSPTCIVLLIVLYCTDPTRPPSPEPMIKNTAHSSIGCNGMANNDDYHGLEMYKNHAKDSTTEVYLQPDPTTMECM